MSTTERGYGAPHQRERERWRPDVEAGRVDCWRCGERILPGADWDLGHDDFDRAVWTGPEHLRCNRVAGSRKGHARRREHRRTEAARDLGPNEWVNDRGQVCFSVPVDEI